MHYQILFLPKMIINLSTVLISTFVPPSMNYIDDTESDKAIKYVHKDIKTNMDNHFFSHMVDGKILRANNDNFIDYYESMLCS